MYSLICKGSLRLPRNYDLRIVLSVYNFGFWFDGENCFLQLDEDGNNVVLINTSGKYAIYSSDRGSKCNSLIARLNYILGLHEDLSEFYKFAENDPLLWCFAKKYSGWRVRSTSLWWGLIIGVCQQNASFKQGWSMLYNIIRLYGRKAVLNGKEYPLIPRPCDVLDDPELLIRAKTGYRSKTILRVAREIDRIKSMVKEVKEPDKIESILRSIRGVGSYTARLAMVLALRRYELPPIDRWVKRIISKAYCVSEKIVEKYFIHIWREYSGLAAFATTIALDAVPLRKALDRLRRNQVCPLEDSEIFSPLNLWRHMK